MVHLTILLSDPLVEYVIFISTNMGSAGLLALVCGKGLFLPEDRVELLIYSLQAAGRGRGRIRLPVEQDA